MGNIQNIKKLQIVRNFVFNFNIPAHISTNFRTVLDFEKKYNEKRKENNLLPYNKNIELETISSESIKLLDERLQDHRIQIIPWIDSVKPLKRLRILEIGCGNGTSTIAFAEQGAIVTAIDVDEELLLDAKLRCQVYDLEVKFHLMNATEVAINFPDEVFDLVIFMASLEHMTLDERLKSMKVTYDLLPKGGLWCIVGTPNRLHFLDSHTSQIPFFHWLPDELAIQYAQISSRAKYKQEVAEIADKSKKMELFYRWGRGVSFHEIELALKPLNELKVISNLALFLRKKNFIFKIGTKFTSNYRYEFFLKKRYPTIPQGFFQAYIDIIFEKE
jgi:2-polyprenyl-3-methyl-5-hydroxy-6-metoxy-1,4-benzoquinol methylase